LKPGFLFLVCILPLALHSKSQGDTLQNESEETINPVFITGSGTATKSNASPYQVKVISGKTIAQLGAQNIGEVLQNQSGILLNQDPVLGTGINLQGLSGQSVKILVNGVPMVGRMNGNIDLGQITTGQIDRIEIIEGPMSVIYGSDAIGGVINVITKNCNALPFQQIKGYADAVNNYNLDYNAQFKAKNTTPVFVNAGRQFFGGIDFDTSNRQFDWKPKTKYYANATSQWKHGANTIHTLRIAGYHEELLDRSNAESNLISVIGYNKRFYTLRGEISLNTSHKTKNGKQVQWLNSYNDFHRLSTMVRRDLVTGQETPVNANSQDTTRNRGFNSRAIVTQTKNKNIHWLYGYDAAAETLQSLRTGSPKSITDFAIFLQPEFFFTSAISVRPSVRAMYNNRFANYSIENGKIKTGPIIPGIQTKIAIHKHLTFRASYAQGFRAPTLKELYFLFVDINHNVRGNSNLKSELAHNYISSMDFTHSSTLADIRIVGKGFYNQISNQIQLSLVDASTNLFQYINVGQMNSKGIGAEITAVLGKPSSHNTSRRWNTQAGFDLIRANSKLNDTSKWVGFSTVQSKLNVGYNWHKMGITTQLFLRHSGNTMNFLSTGATYTVRSYNLLDLSITKRFHSIRLNAGKKTAPISLQLGCKNLLGVKQIASQSITPSVHSTSGNLNIAAGRALFCTLNITLQ